MRFSLSPVGILSSGRKELRFRRRSWQVNVRGQSSDRYDSLYPTFRPAAQAGNGLGRQLCRRHSAAMPCLGARFDHRSWTPPQAGTRRASRLDWRPPRPLLRLREDLHLPAVAFASLHPLQRAGSLPGTAAALCGALLLGTGHAYSQRPGPRARFLDAPPLVEWPGPFPTGAFFFPPDARPRRSLASASGSGRSRSWAFILGDSSSANSLAPTSLRNFHGAHHPCLGMRGGLLLTFASGGQQRRGRGYRKTQTALAAARLSAAA